MYRVYGDREPRFKRRISRRNRRVPEISHIGDDDTWDGMALWGPEDVEGRIIESFAAAEAVYAKNARAQELSDAAMDALRFNLDGTLNDTYGELLEDHPFYEKCLILYRAYVRLVRHLGYFAVERSAAGDEYDYLISETAPDDVFNDTHTGEIQGENFVVYDATGAVVGTYNVKHLDVDHLPWGNGGGTLGPFVVYGKHTVDTAGGRTLFESCIPDADHRLYIQNGPQVIDTAVVSVQLVVYFLKILHAITNAPGGNDSPPVTMNELWHLVGLYVTLCSHLPRRQRTYFLQCVTQVGGVDVLPEFWEVVRPLVADIVDDFRGAGWRYEAHTHMGLPVIEYMVFLMVRILRDELRGGVRRQGIIPVCFPHFKVLLEGLVLHVPWARLAPRGRRILKMSSQIDGFVNARPVWATPPSHVLHQTSLWIQNAFAHFGNQPPQFLAYGLYLFMCQYNTPAGTVLGAHYYDQRVAPLNIRDLHKTLGSGRDRKELYENDRNPVTAISAEFTARLPNAGDENLENIHLKVLTLHPQHNPRKQAVMTTRIKSVRRPERPPNVVFSGCYYLEDDSPVTVYNVILGMLFYKLFPSDATNVAVQRLLRDYGLKDVTQLAGNVEVEDIFRGGGNPVWDAVTDLVRNADTQADIVPAQWMHYLWPQLLLIFRGACQMTEADWNNFQALPSVLAALQKLVETPYLCLYLCETRTQDTWLRALPAWLMCLGVCDEGVTRLGGWVVPEFLHMLSLDRHKIELPNLVLNAARDAYTVNGDQMVMIRLCLQMAVRQIANDHYRLGLLLYDTDAEDYTENMVQNDPQTLVRWIVNTVNVGRVAYPLYGLPAGKYTDLFIEILAADLKATLQSKSLLARRRRRRGP